MTEDNRNEDGPTRPSQEAAEAAVEAFLTTEFGEDAPTACVIEDGDTSYAFYVLDHDTTSYVHSDLRIEWYGTSWVSNPSQYAIELHQERMRFFKETNADLLTRLASEAIAHHANLDELFTEAVELLKSSLIDSAVHSADNDPEYREQVAAECTAWANLNARGDLATDLAVLLMMHGSAAGALRLRESVAWLTAAPAASLQASGAVRPR